MILSAQAVPSAAMLPCIAALPPGWSTSTDIISGNSTVQLYSDRAGLTDVNVTLTAACDTSGTRQVPSGQPGMRRYEGRESLAPQSTVVRYDTFPGGCIAYLFSFAPGASRALASEAASALSFQPRSALVDYVRRTEGLALCGRGAACPP
jgi:hypothetical protein